jgi:hypothetical protein
MILLETRSGWTARYRRLTARTRACLAAATVLARLKHLVAILAIAVAPSAALGCECSYAPIGDSTVRASKSIFVFQLLAAEVQYGEEVAPASQAIAAKVRVIEHLSGQDDRPAAMSYNTLRCCGTRLDVGHFYAAFLSEPGDPFFGHPGNLLHLGEFYEPESSRSSRLKSVVSGELTLEDAYGRFPDERQNQFPPPPPPCPRESSRQRAQ